MPHVFDVVVVGSGAAGLMAAISAARRGASVVLAERLAKPGKKILVTGGGRCNLTNENLDASVFTTNSPPLVEAVFRRFRPADILDLFHGLGLETASEGGRVFPITGQAASVLKVLTLEIRRLGVSMILEFEAAAIEGCDGAFIVSARDGRKIEARKIILAGGGKSYPALGSNGSGYDLAAACGHRIILPVPSAVPVLAKDRLCHALQGQRVRTRIAARIGGKMIQEADGDLLFTAYGLSGTAVLDVSECLSIALNRDCRKDVALSADLVPFLTRERLAGEIGRRRRSGWAEADWLSGILPEKFSTVLTAFRSTAKPGGEGPEQTLASALKDKRFPIQGTRGWNEAEFTAGGVDAREIDSGTLESKRRRGLFLAGEILDVQGPRGGYNLAWAWASGMMAGEAAAGR
jgi:predicted Rossmann fold flavoprotein